MKNSFELKRVALATTLSPVLLTLAIVLVYAICFAAIKAGLVFAPPLRFGALRALLAGIVLLALIAIIRGPLLPSWQNWGWLLALAATATTITFGGMFLSPGRTGAGIASVLGNTQPFITVGLATLFLKEQLTRGKLVTLLLGLIGVGLIASPALLGSDVYSFFGSVTALASSTGAAAGNIIVKRMEARQELLTITAWQLIVGSLPLFLISQLVEAEREINWNWQFVGLLLFLALIGTSFATAVWYWLIQRSEVGRLTLLFFLVPVFGLGLAAWIFGEAIGLAEAVGTGLIVAGVTLSIWESRGGKGEKSSASVNP